MTVVNSIPTDPQKVVRLAVTESEDPSHDAHLLREVIGVLLEYPGRDRVNLDIRTNEKLVRMDLPVVSTGYCEGLHSRLEELLGTDTVTVHQELGLGIDSSTKDPVTMPLESGSMIDAESVSAEEPPAATEFVESEMPAIVAEVPKFEEPSVAAETPAGVATGDEPPF